MKKIIIAACAILTTGVIINSTSTNSSINHVAKTVKVVVIADKSDVGTGD